MPLTFTLGGLCCDKDAAKFYFNTSRRSLAALAFAGVGEVSPNPVGPSSASRLRFHVKNLSCRGDRAQRLINARD
jgi:hypothetical protein